MNPILILLIIFLKIIIDTNQYHIEPVSYTQPIPEQQTITTQQHTTIIQHESYTTIFKRNWNDTYAMDSEGYCPYEQGYGWDNSLIWPVTGEITTAFEQEHLGIDIAVLENTPVYASQSGVVSWAGASQFGGGKIVVVSHGNDWYTIYAHFNEVLVQCSQTVLKGDLLGLSGQTGASYPHVHFAVNRGDFTFDPLEYLPQ